MTGDAVEILKNVGQAAWTVLKENKPQSSVDAPHANAIPGSATSAMDLTWPSKYSSMELKFHFPRAILDSPEYGTNWTLLVQWSALGKYKGKGKYLSEASVSVAGDSQYGTTTTIDAKFGGPKNVGTDDEQIPQMQLTINIKLNSLLQDNNYLCTGFVSGDGSGELKFIA